MRNYIEYFQDGGVPEKYIKRVDNDPNKAGVIKGIEFIALDKGKEILNSIMEEIKKYVELEKNIPKLHKGSSDNSYKYPDIGTIIASRGYVYNPTETN